MISCYQYNNSGTTTERKPLKEHAKITQHGQVITS